MLVLTRKQNEKIRIGDQIVVTVLRMKGKAVRLGIEAPNHVEVLRGELAFQNADDAAEGEPSPSARQKTADVEDPVVDRPAKAKARSASELPTTNGNAWPVDRPDGPVAAPNQTMIVQSAPLRGMLAARVR